MLKLVKRFLRRKQHPIDLLQRRFLRKSDFQSVIHVGAHTGQERDLYEAHGFHDTLRVEGIPKVFKRLSDNINAHVRNRQGRHQFPRHRVVGALPADRDGHEAEFSNDGQFSSIFHSTTAGQHRWPGLCETGHVEILKTRTLDCVASEFEMCETVDTLDDDVQGAEPFVLAGAERVLQHAKAVICEASTIPFYDGGVLYPKLHRFLTTRGFLPRTLPRQHGDILFLRQDLAGEAA